MFSNYISGAVVSSHNHCDHPHTNLTPGVAVKDDYGNVVKLQWTPTARFSVNITSDSWVPVVDGSVILNQPGQTPHDVVGINGDLAYNTADYKCWMYLGGTWKEQDDIATQDRGKTIMLFSSQAGMTRAVLKNFRGEQLHVIEGVGNTATLTIDDELSDKLLQGYYNIDVYLVLNSTTKFIRKISVSVGNYVKENDHDHRHPCHHPNIVPPNCSQEDDERDAWILSRSLISVATIAERDSLDCRSMPHGRVVRVAQTPNGAMYYSWDQVTYTWKEETALNRKVIQVDSELDEDSSNAIQNKVVVEALKNVEALTEERANELIDLLEKSEVSD
jgi:hypothetical protein